VVTAKGTGTKGKRINEEESDNIAFSLGLGFAFILLLLSRTFFGIIEELLERKLFLFQFENTKKKQFVTQSMMTVARGIPSLCLYMMT
jgi:hypothetical protein